MLKVKLLCIWLSWHNLSPCVAPDYSKVMVRSFLAFHRIIEWLGLEGSSLCSHLLLWSLTEPRVGLTLGFLAMGKCEYTRLNVIEKGSAICKDFRVSQPANYFY